jgi:hypothetical protein
VSRKRQKIAGLIESLEKGQFDPHYVGFFDCFNRQLFFEAHEVLEELWLGQRGRAKDLFYKGLIQLAGAFVHVQKQRRQPALALLKLARANLVRFPQHFDGLEIDGVVQLIDFWSSSLEADPELCRNLGPDQWPKLGLARAQRMRDRG